MRTPRIQWTRIKHDLNLVIFAARDAGLSEEDVQKLIDAGDIIDNLEYIVTRDFSSPLNLFMSTATPGVIK
jgi:hypothetical protein